MVKRTTEQLGYSYEPSTIVKPPYEMIIPIPEANYSLEPESWGYDLDRTKSDEWTTARVNTYILWRITVWKKKGYKGW